MTDNAGASTSETPGAGRGDERLARREELAQLGVEPPAGSGGPGTRAAPGGIWPAVTVVLLTLAAWVPVALTLLRVGVDPDPFAFRTDNVFWVLTITGSAATTTLAAGVAGLRPRATGSGVLRVAASVLIGAQLFVLGVIAVIQVLWDARTAIMAQALVTIVAVLLAGSAVLLALRGARAERRGRTAAGARDGRPLAGLVCALVGQVALAVGVTTQFPGEFGIYVVSLLISTLTAAATLTGLWLVGRGHGAAGWVGAGVLCLMAVLSVGSLVNLFALVDLPPAHLVVQAAQYLVYAAGAVTAVLAARAGARTGA